MLRDLVWWVERLPSWVKAVAVLIFNPFTLAVLVAITLPTFVGVRDRAEERQRRAEERQAQERESDTELPPPPYDRDSATRENDSTPEYDGPDSSRAGASAVCEDGTYSNSTGPGTCSYHGGIDHYLP